MIVVKKKIPPACFFEHSHLASAHTHIHGSVLGFLAPSIVKTVKPPAS
jgi:hypothetical protein